MVVAETHPYHSRSMRQADGVMGYSRIRDDLPCGARSFDPNTQMMRISVEA